MGLGLHAGAPRAAEDARPVSPVYSGRLEWVTFTPSSPPSPIVSPEWLVVNGRVVNRRLGITVTPTDDVYHRPCPDDLCAALNRVYGTPATPETIPTPSSSPGAAAAPPTTDSPSG